MNPVFPKFTEDVPLLLTEATLDRYAAFLAATSGADAGATAVGPPKDSTDGGDAEVPSSADEALAPLELLYGKTFVHALSIALHGAEAVTCYVENDSALASPSPSNANSSSCGTGDGGGSVNRQTEQGAGATAATLFHPLRRLYRVGEHVLLSPHYCPCSAYTYQSIRRQEVWCCKHLLALQIVLKLESVGIRQANVITREVDHDTFCALSRESIDKAK